MIVTLCIIFGLLAVGFAILSISLMVDEQYAWGSLSILGVALALLICVFWGGIANKQEREGGDRDAKRCTELGGEPRFSPHSLNYLTCEGLEEGTS